MADGYSNLAALANVSNLVGFDTFRRANKIGPFRFKFQCQISGRFPETRQFVLKRVPATDSAAKATDALCRVTGLRRFSVPLLLVPRDPF